AADALTEIAGCRLPQLRDVFARALAEDPHDRFETALEFAEALKAAFPDVTIAAPSPSAALRTAEPRAADTHAPGAPRLPLHDPEPVAAIPIRAARSMPAEAAESLDLNFPSERLQQVDE